MDPLSSPIVEALKLRPIQSVNTNLSVLLRDGLIVAGEILDVHGSTAFLSLGGKRVAAETDVELEPGQRFLARVGREGDAVVLRLLRDAAAEELPLVAALRTALAEHAPAGTLLSRLATVLRAALLRPETGGTPTGPPAHPDRAPRSADAPPSRTVAVAQALLTQIQARVFSPAADGRLLQEALARTGLFHEALLLAGGPAAESAEQDIKTLLMRAMADLTPGPERESVRRALAGLEAEQLLDVARSQTGDARQISFAVPDGARFADAHLYVDPDGRPDEDERGADRNAHAAVDVAVELSTLGPVRAELRLEDGALRVRFLVASADVAARLAQDQAALCAELGRDIDPTRARTAVLSVALVDEATIVRDSRPEDVRYLGEHRLVDRTA